MHGEVTFTICFRSFSLCPSPYSVARSAQQQSMPLLLDVGSSSHCTCVTELLLSHFDHFVQPLLMHIGAVRQPLEKTEQQEEDNAKVDGMQVTQSWHVRGHCMSLITPKLQATTGLMPCKQAT